jgi:hypothetical protein
MSRLNLASLAAALLLASSLTAGGALAQARSEDNMGTPSEDNMGVMTEDGFRTTQPSGSGHANSGAYGGSGSAGRGGPGSGSAAAVGITNDLFGEALANEPLVPAAQNPLLGRWRTTGGNVGMDLSSIGPLGEMSMGMMAGGCESMFGKVVVFGPSSFERVTPDGHTQVLRHVEYHGRGATIAVLARGSGTQPTIMRLSDPDHAVSAMGCTLQRDASGGDTRPAYRVRESTPGAQLANAPVPPPMGAPTGPPNATLKFQVGVSEPGRFTPLANAPLWVMAQDPRANYTAAGLPLPSGMPLLAKLASDCRSLPVCQGEVSATVRGALGRVLTDAQGHAQTPQIAAGRYYVVGVSNIQGKPLIWVQPVNVQAGMNVVTLDQLNGRSPG